MAAITQAQQADAAQRWQALQDQANRDKSVTKAQVDDLKKQLQADGFDVGANTKLGQQLNSLSTIIDNTTTKGASNLETDTTWYEAAQAINDLVGKPDTNAVVDTAANYTATSTALGASIGDNKKLTEQLAKDAAAGNKDAVAKGVTDISANVDTQIKQVQEGVANGSIDSTLGQRMVGDLQQAKFAMNVKGADGAPAPDMKSWDAMAGFYATRLSQVTATDNGGAAAASAKDGSTAGAGTIATGAASGTTPAPGTSSWTAENFAALYGKGDTAFAKFADDKLSGQVVKGVDGQIDAAATVKKLADDKVEMHTNATGNVLTYDPATGGGGVFDGKGGSLASPSAFYPSAESKKFHNAGLNFNAGGFDVTFDASGKGIAVKDAGAAAVGAGAEAKAVPWTADGLKAVIGDGKTAFANYAKDKLSGQVVRRGDSIDVDATLKNLLKDKVELYASPAGNFLTYDPSSGGGGVFDGKGASIASPGGYYPSKDTKKFQNGGMTFDSGGFHVVVNADGKGVKVKA